MLRFDNVPSACVSLNFDIIAVKVKLVLWLFSLLILYNRRTVFFKESNKGGYFLRIITFCTDTVKFCCVFGAVDIVIGVIFKVRCACINGVFTAVFKDLVYEGITSVSFVLCFFPRLVCCINIFLGNVFFNKCTVTVICVRIEKYPRKTVAFFVI